MPAVSPAWRRAGWRIFSDGLGVCIFAAGTAQAAAAPSRPQSRLLNTWLDLRLVGIFYPDTIGETLLPNLAKVAGAARSPLP